VAPQPLATIELCRGRGGRLEAGRSHQLRMKSATDLLPNVSMTDAGAGGRNVPNTGCAGYLCRKLGERVV
jgi:hypothetical protein